MACDKCLDKWNKKYQAELNKLTKSQRLDRSGEQLQGRYKVLMSGVCQHQVSISK